MCRAPRRNPAGEQGNGEQQSGDSRVSYGVAGRDAIEEIGERAGTGESGGETRKQTNCDKGNALAQNHFLAVGRSQIACLTCPCGTVTLSLL